MITCDVQARVATGSSPTLPSEFDFDLDPRCRSQSGKCKLRLDDNTWNAFFT